MILLVVQYVVAALAIIALCALLWGVFFRPAQTFGFVGFVALMNRLLAYPLISLTLIGVFLWLEHRHRIKAPPAAQSPSLITHKSADEDTTGGTE